MANLSSPVAVLRSKIERPSLAGHWVRRPHIESRLDRAIERSLILITAPAGHGKTSTIACWLASGARRRLDDGRRARYRPHPFRDPRRRRPRPHCRASPPSASRLLAAPDRLGPSELGEAFGEALYDLERDALLVLDDFHAAGSVSGVGIRRGVA